MMNNRLISTIGGGLLLATAAGCTVAPTVDSQRRDKLAQQAADTRPTCASVSDCDAMWQAAQLWIVKNAGYKIQTMSGVIIETYGPKKNSGRISVQALKEPMGGGRYQITAKVWCGNWMGCLVPPVNAVLDFNRTVTAAVSGV